MNLYEILTSDNVIDTINENINYLISIIPELQYMINYEHKNPDHHLNVWDHTLYAISLSENDFDKRLVLLLHDIAKPLVSYEKNNIRHYDRHQLVGALISYDILKRLGYEEDYINKICFYIKNHDYPISSILINEKYDDALFLYKIQTCDMLAHNPDKLERRKKYLKKIERKLENC